ncbi:ABC transporter ATP-binding protein [Aureibacillus halotolerans]|uniref:ABC-type nitrate/sulfonate/bicarbonate transport system ATPase subunit n=1 Tax=Aureibacillus halotolerans TaxID=1508390 RepID=A0A4R6TWU6_9BACI|nr:ABC transporter ATP-binding protein [Aureibacillus halotolerans]TDQ36743.1 ABC-type nitrate/sulfonate/bicarbonate transport system ATPase subunit [Aureibacillus halotolerans]
MNQPLIEVQAVEKAFGETVALASADLTVHSGEFVSIIGQSGCGKSTLLDIISGLVGPDRGDIFLDGQSVLHSTGHAGYMPQQDVLLPWRTIIDNVILPLQIDGTTKKAARKIAQEQLPKFGLEGFGDRYPDALSGGMKQRASFLRTCLTKKKLLLLDEPFGKLDALTRLEMQQWLVKLAHSMSLTILFVTHDIDEALLLSDRIYVMSPRPGRIVKELHVEGERPRSMETLSSPQLQEQKQTLLKMLFDQERS